MGPEAAVNAVYANRIGEIQEDQARQQFVDARRAEYEADVDLLRLASDLVVDAIVEPEELRREITVTYRLGPRQTQILQRPPPRRAAGVTAREVR